MGMCRLLVFAGHVGNYVVNLIKSFVDSVRYDPYLRKILPHKSSHDSGWGIALVDGSSIHYYKTSKPLFDDRFLTNVIEVIKQLDYAVILIHGRAAGGEPLNYINSHPMIWSCSDGSYMILAHNGSVRKVALASELGISELVNHYNDTYFLLRYLGSKLGFNSSPDEWVEVLKGLMSRDIVLTAINLGIVMASPSGFIKLVVVNAFKEVSDDYTKYYRMYEISSGEYLIYTSSTLVDHYLRDPLGNIRSLSNNELVLVNVDLSSKYLNKLVRYLD